MWEKIEENTNLGSILIDPFLLNSCHSNKKLTQHLIIKLLIIQVSFRCKL